MKRLQVRKWRGFKVEIFNNGGRHRLHYEWKVYPLSPHLKKIAGRRSRKLRVVKVIHDHTSTYDKLECWLDAKVKINEMREFARLLAFEAYWQRATS